MYREKDQKDKFKVGNLVQWWRPCDGHRSGFGMVFAIEYVDFRKNGTTDNWCFVYWFSAERAERLHPGNLIRFGTEKPWV